MSRAQVEGRIDGESTWLKVYHKWSVFPVMILGEGPWGVLGNIYVLTFDHYKLALVYRAVLVEMVVD